MSIKVGDIVKIDDAPGIYQVGNKQKKKFGILVSLGKNWFFYVNSENRALYDCIPIAAKTGRTFPYHDSYIGCHRPFEVDPSKINNPPIATLEKEELESLLAKVNGSERLSAEQIKEISASIEEAIKNLSPAAPSGEKS